MDLKLNLIMTRHQRKTLITDCLKQYKEANSFFEDCSKILGAGPESELFSLIFRQAQKIVDLTSTLVGDNSGWIDWYISENNFGENGYPAGYDQKIKSIRAIEDLLDLIDIDRITKKKQNKQ